eukprot:gene1640-1791_t
MPSSIPIVIDGSYGSLVIGECKRLTNLIRPISDRYYGPMNKASADNTLFPFVLLLGNHSSGKSSFINYLLGRKVQTTGVAPTDDNFTIIGPGEEDLDRNGPALVGDPDLGFSELKGYGNTLINHTQLKVRANTAVKDFMIVDSPGMIDSPASKGNNTLIPPSMDRGYNFDAVCRWYAERADVILLFFDPDKPGTTGETLSILTNSLVGFDHKLYIILNKADQFCKIHDFARAYGSLCWNLSKVIPRKDLPRIHTMCLPTIAQTTPSSDLNNSKEKTFFDQAMLDLEEARGEVLREVFNAPRRRVDNEMSRLFENVSALVVHCGIVDQVVSLYSSRLWRSRLITSATTLVSAGLTIGATYLQNILHKNGDVGKKLVDSSSSVGARLLEGLGENALVVSTAAIGITATAITTWWQNRRVQQLLESFSSRKAYEQIFESIYAKEIMAQDEFIISVGSMVLDRLPVNVSPEIIPTLRHVQKADRLALERILQEDLANLRRRASPNFPQITPVLDLSTPPSDEPTSPESIASAQKGSSAPGSPISPFRSESMSGKLTPTPRESHQEELSSV